MTQPKTVHPLNVVANLMLQKTPNFETMDRADLNRHLEMYSDMVATDYLLPDLRSKAESLALKVSNILRDRT